MITARVIKVFINRYTPCSDLQSVPPKDSLILAGYQSGNIVLNSFSVSGLIFAHMIEHAERVAHVRQVSDCRSSKNTCREGWDAANRHHAATISRICMLHAPQYNARG